jgi:peptidoglycan/LPS O-acetylase OafA/YrhL
MRFGEIVATAVLGPIENRNWLVLAMAIATVAISIAYVHWIDSPFERWRQRRTMRATTEQRAPASLPQPQPVALSA